MILSISISIIYSTLIAQQLYGMVVFYSIKDNVGSFLELAETVLYVEHRIP